MGQTMLKTTMKPLMMALALTTGLAGTAAACSMSPGHAAAMVSLVNAERARAGLGTVALDGSLMQAAQSLACDNARARSYSHTGADGSDLRARVKRAGYRLREAVENTFLGRNGAGAAVGYWARSGGHRANMLEPGVTGAGVGVAATGDGREAWVLVLGRNG